MTRKAQISIEFLMTYGWIAMVFLIIVGALAWYGSYSAEDYLPSECIITGLFDCMEYKVEPDKVLIKVKNNQMADVNSFQMRVTGMAASNYSVDYGPVQLGAGDDTGLLELPGSIGDGKFKGKIEITYQRAGDSVTHTTSGQIYSQVEPASGGGQQSGPQIGP